MKNIFYAFCFVLFFGLSVDLNAQFDVVWTDLVGVSVSGNTVTMTATSGWGNGGAASENILAGSTDGWVEINLAYINSATMIGLSNSNIDAHYNTIDYAFFITNGNLYIYENGNEIGAYGSAQSSDILKVERISSQIFYKKNGATLYSTSTVYSDPLIVDCSLNNTSSTISLLKTSFDVPPNGSGSLWQQNGNDIFYDTGAVSVNTSTATKAFSVYNSGTAKTEFQVNGDGKAYAREVEVTLNTFPDYVFEKEYSLMPLNKLKTYIEENKHLPNIPAGNIIDNNGIGLGDLSHKQMEKIEELTLYILQLDERIQKLEQENKNLKTEVKQLKKR